MSCNHYVIAVTMALNEIDGIRYVMVNPAKSEAKDSDGYSPDTAHKQGTA